MEHEGEEFEEVHFDDDDGEEPMDSDGEMDEADDGDRDAQYGNDGEEIENGRLSFLWRFLHLGMFSDVHLRSPFAARSSRQCQPLWSFYRDRWRR